MKKAWYKISEAQANHTKGRDYTKGNVGGGAKSVALYILDRRPQTADRRPQTAGKYNREEFACSHRARILRTQHTPLVRQSGTAGNRRKPQETAPLAR
ncbi:hypothetical protein [Cronobacter sakazakii]|uniref:hypothetical protein n=1 Tax=Cronobacter sakazakii TaxID=28141 RepID=UPI003CEBE96F